MTDRPAQSAAWPRRESWIAAALIAFAAARLLPPLPGLSAAGQAVLGVMAAGTMLWVSEAVPIGLAAIVVIVLLALVPEGTLAGAAGGLASEVVLFLVGAVALGAAVETSGLAARAAHVLTRQARGRPSRLYAQMIASLPFFALLVPSAITRNAILIPAYRDAMARMGVTSADRTGRMLMLALGVLNPLASSALLTGGTVSITAAALLGGFTWIGWFVLMAPPYYALLFGGAFLLRRLTGPFEEGAPRDSSPEPAKPFSAIEIRTFAVLALTSALWLTDTWHRLSPAVPALIGAALLLLPRIGVLSWKTFESRLSWGMILTVGASLSLAAAMTRTGAATWLGGHVLGRLVGEAAGASAIPLLIAAGLVVAVALVHLAITNLAACVALLIPIAATLGARAGLDPVACGLIVTLAVDAIILYPVQTASNLIAFETGYFSAADMRRFGICMLGLTIAVVLLTIPYWGWLGFPFVVR